MAGAGAGSGGGLGRSAVQSTEAYGCPEHGDGRADRGAKVQEGATIGAVRDSKLKAQGSNIKEAG